MDELSSLSELGVGEVLYFSASGVSVDLLFGLGLDSAPYDAEVRKAFDFGERAHEFDVVV